VSKTILGREIPKEQAQKLLTTGKTDLLEGFISKRGRPFSAYLKFEDGKVGFEFPEKNAPAKETKIASSFTQSAPSSCHSLRSN
jgi:DNA topoisomerase III